jgi:hypothetical protein
MRAKDNKAAPLCQGVSGGHRILAQHMRLNGDDPWRSLPAFLNKLLNGFENVFSVLITACKSGVKTARPDVHLCMRSRQFSQGVMSMIILFVAFLL